MDNIWTTILTSGVTATILGFIQFLITRHDNKKNAEDEKISHIMNALRGLGHDRILYLAQSYIERGYISKDEYENLHDYLYNPYKDLGGNGVAEKLMDEVNKLPIRERRNVK